MRCLEESLDVLSISEHEQIPLLQGLEDYCKKDIASFDVPGHVKDQGVELLNNYFGEKLMRMDINSSPRMDNAANPNGIIKEAEELLAKAYKADNAFFLTNGTTQGIHIMILSVLNPGDKIILPRNVHKSAINALILSGGIPIYIQPEYNDELGISLNVTLENVKKALDENNDAKALFLLNPTYYGACSKLKEIVKLCHDRGVLVLVDEAHGAHFPFYDELPPSAMECGADMSAVSLHKTGGALTQASALLINNKNIDDKNVLQHINMLQSTSASYLLMASLDGARSNLMLNGQVQISNALNLARYAKREINKIKGIKIISNELLESKGVYFIDETKLCINVKELNLTGFDVYDLLYKDFDVQVELGDMYNILALISIGTTKSDIDKLIRSLNIISNINNKNILMNSIKVKHVLPKVKLSPREAFYSKKESRLLKDCIGKVSAESIMSYPPGIPIISPGEVITEEIIDYINLLKNSKAHLTDMKDKTLNTILVVK